MKYSNLFLIQFEPMFCARSPVLWHLVDMLILYTIRVTSIGRLSILILQIKLNKKISP